jgi:predicted dehydrogenase
VFRTFLGLLSSSFSKLGPRLKVVALVDPATERAAAVLQQKCESFVKSAYEHTRVCKDLDEFVNTMTKEEYPKAVIIGSPPMFRGSTLSGRDIEIQILKKFPRIALFVEKPVATGPFGELKDVFEVAKAIDSSGNICSVG